MANPFDPLYDFLCDHLKDYPNKATTPGELADLPPMPKAFWERIGFHPAFEGVLQPPRALGEADLNQQRTQMLQLGIPQTLVPRCPLILSDDHYSVWYLDLDQADDDPAVLGLNSDMPAPEQVAGGFSRFVVQQLVTIALQQSPRLLVDPQQPFEAEALFPRLHPNLKQRDGVIVLPFDDSEGLNDTRVNLCFPSLTALIDFCDWEQTPFHMVSGYLEPGSGRGKLKTIRFDQIDGNQLKADVAFAAEEGDVSVMIDRDATRPGWITRPTEAPADSFLLTCDGKSAAAWITWIEGRGGRITKIDNKKPKKK